MKFPETPPGQYRLALALTRRAHDASPYIRLGTDLPEVNGWHVLGETQGAP